jgi:hypothetical protein
MTAMTRSLVNSNGDGNQKPPNLSLFSLFIVCESPSVLSQELRNTDFHRMFLSFRDGMSWTCSTNYEKIQNEIVAAVHVDGMRLCL